MKKGSKSTLGYKAFARTDEDGFIDRVHTTPANRGESPEFEYMIKGTAAQRVLADKAYASKANRERLRRHARDGIMRKAARGRLQLMMTTYFRFWTPPLCSLHPVNLIYVLVHFYLYKIYE